VVFSSSDEKVRLREPKDLDYPLMGVVKVELPRPDKKPISAELADLACTCQPEYIFHRIDKKDTIEEFNKSLKQTWLKNRHAA
jgi:hypothetical protein